MNAWHRGPMVAWDLESTGTDPAEARIVTACAAVLGVGQQPVVQTWLVNPGVDIPDEAAAVHGVTTERAFAEGQPPHQALADLCSVLVSAWSQGWPIVGHNIGGYDLTLLDCELRRHGLPDVAALGGPGHVIDTLCLDRMVDKYRKGKRTLTATCEHYRVRLDGAHDAEFDALASARIAWRIAEKYPALVQVPLQDLHDAQQAAHAEWAEHFQDYLRTKGEQPDAVIDGTWPIRQPARVAA